jgi:3alpha(or 20beta)-hydroxysteroid dehydrogenase
VFGLSGKVALITGGARGQGAGEAEALTTHGARVVIADVTDAAGEALAARLAGAIYLHLDVSNPADWDAAIARVLAEYGRLDLLVNNAAISHFGSIESMEFEDFMRVVAVNLGGTFLGMKKALPALAASRGVIVNVSSISALMGRVNQPAYMASKWAVRGLSKAAALEFADHGVRVNTIIPGLIATEMTHGAYGEAGVKARGKALPVGRAGEPEDIAAMLLFLASPLSGFCTGAEFVCDGGETAGIRPRGEEAAMV